MTDAGLRSILRRLQSVIGRKRGERALSDAELVDAFLHRHDELAVEVLIWRHGAMVFNLCRRIFRDRHHAEDAFQTTFLVFLRKAGSIGKRQAVGSWLYKVAYRVACRLQTTLSKQPEFHAKINEPAEPNPGKDRLDWRLVLDEEINRLPEKYRVPIVLCYWPCTALEVHIAKTRSGNLVPRYRSRVGLRRLSRLAPRRRSGLRGR